jgi:hypothetical protein
LSQYSWLTNPEAGRRFSYKAALRHASRLLLLYLAAGMASASAQTGSLVPTAETIVARMAQARNENRARFRPYIVTRNYKLFGKDESKAKSEVVADVAFVPPDSKTYTIQGTDGSGLGKMIVRRMLAGEAEVTKDYVSTDFSADNYDFRFLRSEDLSGQRCYVLAVLPKRKEDHLLRGDIWVDAKTYLLHRFEGELAKVPSWWVRDVRVKFIYSEVGGMWLQTASEATANVRILGRSTMVSRDTGYKITELVAAGPSAPTNPFNPMFSPPRRHRVIPKPSK